MIHEQKRVRSQFLVSLFLPPIESFSSNLIRRQECTSFSLPVSLSLVFSSHHNGQYFLSPRHTLYSEVISDHPCPQKSHRLFPIIIIAVL